MLKNIAESLLPEGVYTNLKKAYKENITHYQRDIYSEFGEDYVAAVLLGFKKNGFFVDVGAYRPKELSVTYYFYKKLNWNGLIIEPNPAAVGEFKSQRPRDIMINKGVAQNEGELTYFKFKTPTLNSFEPKSKEMFKDQFIESQKIKVEPLKKILEENVPEGRTIDLLNVDAEGLDIDVIQSNDWERFSPKVILIEDHKFHPEKPLESEVVQFLKSKGYVLKANCLVTLVFMKES